MLFFQHEVVVTWLILMTLVQGGTRFLLKKKAAQRKLPGEVAWVREWS